MTELGADIRTADAPRGWYRLVSGRAHYFTGRPDLLAACRRRMAAPDRARPDDDSAIERCEVCARWVDQSRG